MNVSFDALRAYLADFDIPIVERASATPLQFGVRIHADYINACPVISVMNGSTEIGREYISPLLGLRDYQARNLGNLANLPREYWGEFVRLVTNLYRCYLAADALVLQLDELTALGGRLATTGGALRVDENALFRQNRLADDARHAGVTFIPFKGQIGVLANGSGLAMTTMDLIDHYSDHELRAAAFADIGNTLRLDRLAAALDSSVSHPSARAILVALFAADQCAQAARTIIDALRARQTALPPVIVFLNGLDNEAGRALLERAQQPKLISATTLREAVRRAIHAANGT